MDVGHGDPAAAHRALGGATVFTTHATVLGRQLATNDTAFYEHLPLYHAPEEARRCGCEPPHEIECAAAKGADVFTTVSDLTREECDHLLSRPPDLLLPNGLNIHIYGSDVPAEIVLNFTTMGSTVDADAVEGFLGNQAQEGEYFAPTSSELRYSENLGEQGFIQTWAFTFDFSSFEGEADNWALFFSGSQPHLSLDAATVDVRNVPAPGALALLGLAGMARRRRRN